MADSKVQDLFKQEHNSWLKKLETLQMEIVLLKNHVAEIVRNEVNKDTLENLETFQTNFLSKDMIIALLRRDILQLNAILEDNRAMDTENAVRLIYKKQDVLRKDITKMESELTKIKSEFRNLQIS